MRPRSLSGGSLPPTSRHALAPKALAFLVPTSSPGGVANGHSAVGAGGAMFARSPRQSSSPMTMQASQPLREQSFFHHHSHASPSGAGSDTITRERIFYDRHAPRQSG
jgi:hypothetical protein